MITSWLVPPQKPWLLLYNTNFLFQQLNIPISYMTHNLLWFFVFVQTSVSGWARMILLLMGLNILSWAPRRLWLRFGLKSFLKLTNWSGYIFYLDVTRFNDTVHHMLFATLLLWFRSMNLSRLLCWEPRPPTSTCLFTNVHGLARLLSFVLSCNA